MADGISGLGYIPRKSPIHNLTGAAKLLMVVLTSVAVMITYDTRFLVGSLVLAVVVFAVSRIKLSELRYVIFIVTALMLLNTVVIYLFSPEEGVRIYGTRHVLHQFTDRYTMTAEQLFYLANVVLKYFSVLPVALLFITTTEPSEFASSLNRLRVSYRVAYAVALTLRYIPDVQRDFVDISQAQQARGIDMSRNVSLPRRLKSVTGVLFPLIFSSLDRVGIVASAMELRGFGKLDKRTWYRARRFRAADFIAIGVCALLVAISLTLNYLNKGRFYNPFI
jgi:energy-coupling factor transport system permease protein